MNLSFFNFVKLLIILLFSIIFIYLLWQEHKIKTIEFKEKELKNSKSGLNINIYQRLFGFTTGITFLYSIYLAVKNKENVISKTTTVKI